MKKQGSGWHGESRRHSLARKGVKTTLPDGRRFDVSKFVARGEHNLYYSVVGEKSHYFDFSEGYGERWEVWQPDFYDMTKEELIELMEYEGYDVDSGWDKDELIDHVQAMWWEQNNAAMNYLYPLPDNFTPSNDDWKGLRSMIFIYDIDEDKYYLNLAGAGQDFSWEICESYINLGYYPPADFCRLPRLAGKDYGNPKNKKIIECCIESLDTVSGWAINNKKDLERMLKGD